MLNISALTQPFSSLAYFALLARDDEHFPLLECAACVAQDEYEDLDVQEVLDLVDALIARLKRTLPADAPSLNRVVRLNQFFYADLGFSGNVNDYYAADNSYLNIVLHTRRGIPITVGMIWLELARSLNIKAAGVNFPGHFLINIDLPQGQIMMDPLNGDSLSPEELLHRLSFYKDIDTQVTPDMLLGLYLQPARPRDMVIRLLHNLKQIHRNTSDWERLVKVQNRLIILRPQAWDEYRDRGLALAKLQRKTDAIRDLDCYLANTPHSSDREMVLLTRAQLLSPDR